MSKPENTPERAVGRRRDGTWKKGHSGNPGGRSGQAAKIRAALAAGADDVAEIVLEAARGGDIAACRLVLERLVPSLKPVAEPVQFDLDDSDLPASARSILSAVADGRLPPDQGRSLIDAVVSMARVIEVAELEQQLAELREMLEARK
ncbi:hypothetical protein E0E52_12980 [Azotobacter chroococcum]|nr:hypothetical protein E0E52_12980 [Azotobacter chroococcum]